METSGITIQCSNPNCQAPNPLANQACGECGTPLIRRYLWAFGNWSNLHSLGQLVEGRYLLKYPRIFLDTQPALPPNGPEEMPSYLLPYFKLFPYQPHIPQIGGYLPSPDEEIKQEIWLLEYGTVPTDSQGELRYPNLLPELTELWTQAVPLRQLSWLWQAVQLWTPLESRGVTRTLLELPLLRINGGILQLLELRDDGGPAPSFSQLGETWSPLLTEATPAIANFLEQVCQNLQQGKIRQPQQLASILKRGMAKCAQSQQQTCQIFTVTDTGPTREHNEDACYPLEPETVTVEATEMALAIVCDGIGGQDAGEVASQLAIETLLTEREFMTPAAGSSLSQRLERGIRVANNAIIKRNNEENRRDLRRMGTTLVLALSHAHEIYLTHVGDSRAYRITPESCHQLTVDDDLASREVRLGYLLYRDAIQYPNSGSLTQALGVTDSRSLHPTVQHLILEEDCLFLLCSDGLSDRDRVEQYWHSEIAPLFAGKRELAEVGQRLLALANKQNGHDNVTIALLYFQLQPPTEQHTLSFAELVADLSGDPELKAGLATQIPSAVRTQPLTVITPPPRRHQRQFPLSVIAAMTLLGVGAIALILWWRTTQSTQSLSSPPIAPTASPLASATPNLTAGQVFQIETSLLLQTMPQVEANGSLTAGTVPSGSTLQVLQVASTGAWLELQVCQSPPPATTSPDQEKLLPEGQSGWIQASDLNPAEITTIPVTGESLGSCTAAKTEGETPPKQ
jgi:protein phosphatase